MCACELRLAMCEEINYSIYPFRAHNMHVYTDQLIFLATFRCMLLQLSTLI